MTKLITCILLFSVAMQSSCVVLRRYPLLKLVTTLSELLETKCTEVLFHKDLSSNHLERLRNFFKVTAASHTSKSYILENYKDMKQMESRVPMSMCNRPLRIAIGNNDSQIPYEQMSHWTGSSLMRPVSLVILTVPVEEFFQNVSLPINLITIAAVVRGEKFVELYDIYRVDADSPLKVQKVGFWAVEYGLQLHMTALQYIRRKFDGKLFRAVSVEFWPYVTFNGFMEKNMTWDGIYPRIWRDLESTLNFTSVSYREKAYGVQLPDRRWTGMVRSIVDNEADVIVTDLIISPSRVHVLDFINVLPETSSRLYHRQVGFQYSWYIAFLPFSLEVWMVIIVCCLALTSTMFFSLKMSLMYGTEPGLGPAPYSDFMFFPYRSFLQQGSNVTRSSYSGRLLNLTAYVTATVLFVAYGAFLMSYLSRKIPWRPFDDFDGLVEDGSYKVLLDNNTFAHNFFANASGEKLQKINKAIQPFAENHHVNFTSTGLDLICKNSRLALIEKELIMKSMNPGAFGCDIIEVKQYLRKVQEGIAFRKGSPYVTFIRFYAHRMREAGLIQRQVQNLKNGRASVGPEVMPIDLQQVFFVFLFWFLGVIGSIILLGVETALARDAAQKRRRNFCHIFGQIDARHQFP